MDEDDSQDELINRSASQSKGKRPAVWDISDDSEDDEAESDEGESDSGEEEGEDNLDEDGEEEEEEEEEGKEEENNDHKNWDILNPFSTILDIAENEEEEEEDAQAEDGALGGTSADVAGLSSSDEDADKCPICLNSFTSQPVVTPESCEHYFCLDCILEWAKNANSCPVDRITFNNIYLRKCYGGKVKKVITVQKPVKEVVEEIVDLDLEQTSCEVCGGSDREDRLLLCDGCDAGYHMECLTPPLDSVPVEEWFCPECEVSNVQHSRVSAEEVSDTESLPSSARPATSRSQSRVPGPTRAIARTQHSERVRANVNRHRITQARTSQLAPTYMMQSTWLDDTINAVVAGLNTAVYVRNFTPRVPSTRRRKTRRRRKKTTSAKGKNGKVASTGVKRRKRRRTKSRRRMVLKKPITPRRRIANNLGIVKDKKSSSLPTVYRPAENTLSNMRADIGAASLSIYGDPFNLDPFVEHEEEQQQDRVTSLLEAKRRGISRSALRSHQPVARPVTASLSRRGMDVPQSGGVMEAAPVPDLLGSILSGQNMLLMDSSDVVINRDGTLKATKQMLPSALTPSCSNSSGDASADINPMMSPNQVDSCMSPPYSSDLPGSSRGSTNRPFSQSSSRLPSSSSSYLPSSQIQPSPHSDLAPRGPHSLQPPRPIRPPQPPGHRATNGFPTSSIHPTHPQSQPKKAAPAKPMWVDVSVLPRIPKIKRESGGIANDCTSPGGSIGSNRSRSNRGNSSDSTTSSNGYEMPESGMNSLAGDKGRQQSVDQQKGRTDGQRQRQSDGGAGSSTTTTTAFSNSFSSSSSSTGSPASHPRYPSSSSSSSGAVSFRINASWQSRRLSVGSSSATGESVQERWRKKEEEVKKRQLRRDKQMLLASHTAVDKEQESSTTTIYDPFEPTNSESSSSDDEAKNTNPGASSLHATHERKAPSLENRQSKHDLIHVKTERQEIEVSQEQPTRASAQETPSQEARGSQEYVKVKKEKTEKQTALPDTKVKKEPESDEADEAERFAHRLNSDTAHNTTPLYLNPDCIKMERDTTEEESGPRTSTSVSATSKNDSSSASNSASDKKKQKAVTKPDSKSCSKSPSRDGSHKKKSSQPPSRERRSTTPDNERDRRGERHASGQAGRQKDKQKEKEKERERSGRRSRSRERRKTRTASESSVSDSPDRTRRKRRPSRSPSKDRRRSRSGSSSGSREHSRKKKQKRSSKERNDGRERDTVRRPVSRDKRRARSRTKSVSKSRSRSRSKEQKRGRSRSRSLERRKKEPTHTRAQPSSLCPRDKMESRPKDKRIRRSRSSSRERRKGEVSSSSKSSEKTSKPSVSSRKDTKPLPDKKKDKGQTRSSVKEQKVASGTKAEPKAEAHSCTVASKVKREGKEGKPLEGKDLGTDSQATTTEMVKEIKVEKEIKKEKQTSLDMFEDSPFTEPIKKEEADTQSLADVEGKDELGTKEVTVQTETCVLIKTEPIDDIKTEPIDHIETEPSDITIMNSEQSSPKLCEEPPVTSCSTQTIPVKAESIQDDVSQSHPVSMASVEQPNTVVSTVHIKQELQQPSDSDDDFNVDVMLDNLDYVKSEPEPTEGTSVKQEKDPEEEKTDGQILPIVGGAKSKTQVKRVTWNIQEPEGPQPEKSASKLALYKLKLKQEGARRPSSSVQTSSQDVTGAVSAVGPISSSSRSDGEGLSTSGEGETEERTNQQYLKKLHMQERAVEEVKLAIKPFYQKRDIDKDEYKEILRKAVQKVCHSKSGEINPVKVGNLVKAYVDKYRHARKYKKEEDSEGQTESMNISDSP